MAIRPGVGSRRQRKQLRNPNPDTRNRMLEAAAELIRREGVRQLRVEEIAEHAGVSVGTFYLYFEGKDDLFVRLVEEYTARLRHRLTAAYGGEGSFAERMQTALDAYFDFAEENAAGFLHFRDIGFVDTTVGQLSGWAVDQHAADLRPVLEVAMANGEIRATDPVLLAQAMLGMAQHLVGFWLQHRDHCSRPALTRFINELLAFGSAPRPPSVGEVDGS